MSGGDIARPRNPTLVESLRGDYVARREFYGDGARCQSFISTIAGAGGNLRFGHLIDNSPWLYGRAGSLLAETAITSVDYLSTTNGGPHVSYDGATKYFSSADAPWQEPTTNSFLVGGWVNAAAFAVGVNNNYIVSKFTTTGNQRSWGLSWNGGSGAFIFNCNALGTAAGNVSVSSSYNEQLNSWYLVFGLFIPSSMMRIYVASPFDNDLTIDSLVVGVPASLYDGTSGFAIGCRSPGVGAAEFWNGYIGMLLGRCGVSTATIDGRLSVDDHVRRLWNETRQLYLA
jgi:hypothetical protein